MFKTQYILLISFIYLFYTQAESQTIFSSEKKYGIIDNLDNKVAVPPNYDTIIKCFKHDGFGEKNTNHGFILRRGNKSYFVLRQYLKTGFSRSKDYAFGQHWGEVNSIKWQIVEQEFDTLFPIQEISKNRKDSDFKVYELYQGDTCLNNYTTTFTLAYRKGKKLGLLTYDRVSRVMEKRFNNGIENSKVVYSLENIQIYPTKYDKIMSLPFTRGDSRYVDLKFLTTENEGKYGIISLEDNYELEPQFDVPPIKLITNYSEERHYYVKKNGLWGVIYLRENDSVPFVYISYQYQELNEIGKNLRWVNMEQGKSSTGFYLTKEDEPLKMEFIVKYKSLGFTTEKDKDGYYRLNENYIPKYEKHITFIPTMNGKPIIQEKDYEYFCANYEKIGDTSQFFFILKSKRTNLNDNIYKKEGDMLNRATPNSLVIYCLVNDNFNLLSEFTEESEKIRYNIINEHREFNCNFILKSTLLENGKYKHEFFTLERKKTYELISKFPIDYREFPIEDWKTYSSDWHVLKFYTEIPGKKKTKKKTVCHYNVKTKQFYK